MVSSGDYNTISAFYLVDPTTGTEYIPVRDSTTGHAVVAGVNPTIHPGDTYPVWAYFPATPTAGALKPPRPYRHGRDDVSIASRWR